MKTCRKCGVNKPLSAYNKNKQCKFGVIGTCKDCQKTYLDKWYADNRSKLSKQISERVKNRKRELIELFGGKCSDCKQSYPLCVYTFHHLDPTQKDFNPSYVMRFSEKRMMKELNKCVLLCANCHLIRHHGDDE